VSPLLLLEVEIHFYRSSWLNRLLIRKPYGHVSLYVRDIYPFWINIGLKKEYCGIFPEEYYAYEEHKGNRIKTIRTTHRLVGEAITYSSLPMLYRDLHKRNCMFMASLILGYNVHDVYSTSITSSKTFTKDCA